jgi:DNA-binding NarL/FixJ family response regulator
VLGAIRAAARGGAPLDPKAARVLLEVATWAGRPLSAREEEVLRLVAAGLAKRIAQALDQRTHREPTSRTCSRNSA